VVDDEARLGERVDEADRGVQVRWLQQEVVGEPGTTDRADGRHVLRRGGVVGVGHVVQNLAHPHQPRVLGEALQPRLEAGRGHVDPAHHAPDEGVGVGEAEQPRRLASVRRACTATVPATPARASRGARWAGRWSRRRASMPSVIQS
jgi:hypothetical protein